MESSARIHRALRAKHRLPPTPYHVGEQVLVWRKPSHSSGKWHGPAQIVSLTSTGAYVAVRGVLWKVSRECLRHATPEEKLADDMVNRFLQTHRQQHVK
eukprot:411965-Amphidinium_carterae.1